MSLFTTSIKHPKTFNMYTGKTDLVHKIDSINQSIKLILLTKEGELYGDPSFGCRLLDLLFEQMDDALSSEIQDEIVRALTKWEPRITLTQSDVVVTRSEEDHVTYNVKLYYRVKYSDYESEYETIIDQTDNNGGVR